MTNDRVIYVFSRRAQVPVLHPSGTRDAHHRAPLHTIVCAPGRHGAEEEAPDARIRFRRKSGWDARRGRRWLLLRCLLAPRTTLCVRPKGTSGDRFRPSARLSLDHMKDLYLCLCGASPRKDLNDTGSHWLDLADLSNLQLHPLSLFLMTKPLMTRIHRLDNHYSRSVLC